MNQAKPMYVKTNVEDLADIRAISIDSSLPQKERYREYFRQIKNPHRYRCGKLVITSRYAERGLSFEDCIMRMKE